LEELENRLSIVDAQLDTLSDTKKELDTLKSELVDKIKELKQTE
jgi:prefoldin subunit 5